MFDARAAADGFGKGANQLFHHLRHLFEVPEGLIGFQHGELGVVAPREPFIPEVAVQFKDLGEARNQEPLQVQLGCNPQCEVHAQCVMVRFEWLGRGASRNGLHHGCLHLNKSAGFQKRPDAANNCKAFRKDAAGGFIRDEVKVALTVNGFGVLDAVPFFGQGPQGFRQEPRSVRRSWL